MSYEQRSTWIYFLLSAVVAGIISILFYLSVLTVFNQQQKDILKEKQKLLIFLKPPVIDGINRWEFIGNPKLCHQQYSAYFDYRTDILYSGNEPESNLYGSVRVFGIFPLRLQSGINCLYKFDENVTRLVAAAETFPLREHYGTELVAYGIMCPMVNLRNTDIVQLPQHVALVYDEKRSTDSLPAYTPINYPKRDILMESSNQTLAVCVGPLNRNFKNTLRLVEFIELYRIMGAEKFYFYNVNTSEAVRAVFQHYEQLGVVNIINWNLMRTDHQCDGKSQHAHKMLKLNDCIYRATISDGFEYIAVVDIDEILMPLLHNTLTELLGELEDHRTSAFNFRGTFFHRKSKLDIFGVPPNVRNKFLYTQSIIDRTENLFPVHIRSKYIVRGRYAIEVGKHQIWRAIDGFSETTIRFEKALLFSYKLKCSTDNSCDAPLIVDYTARKYGSLIWMRVENVCNLVFEDGICVM